MTLQKKYIAAGLLVGLTAPILALEFKDYGEMIAIVALIIMAVIVVLYLSGLSAPDRRKRIIGGLIVAVFAITLRVFHSYIFGH